jgi:hypothetical protein
MQTTEQDKNKLQEGTAVQETQQENRTRSRKALSKGEREPEKEQQNNT